MNFKELLAKFSAQESLSFSEKSDLIMAFNNATEEEQKETQATVEATLNKYNDPEKAEMAKQLAEFKESQRFSEVSAKFSDIKAFNMEGEEKEVAQNVLKSFAKLSDEEIANIQKVFSSYQAVVDTLTDHQLSKSFAKKEGGEEDKKEETKGGKKKISESAFTKLCEKHAKEK